MSWRIPFLPFRFGIAYNEVRETRQYLADLINAAKLPFLKAIHSWYEDPRFDRFEIYIDRQLIGAKEQKNVQHLLGLKQPAKETSEAGVLNQLEKLKKGFTKNLEYFRSLAKGPEPETANDMLVRGLLGLMIDGDEAISREKRDELLEILAKPRPVAVAPRSSGEKGRQ